MKFPVRILLVLVSCICILEVSWNSKSDDTPGVGIDPKDATKIINTVVFSVIGDEAYNTEQRDGLISLIQFKKS